LSLRPAAAVLLAACALGAGCNIILGVDKDYTEGPITTTTTGGGGSGGAGGDVGGGGSGGCISVTDCPEPPSACEQPLCLSGECGTVPAPVGPLPPAQQDAGDCKDIVCDGLGHGDPVNNDADLPDDMNDCTIDSCTAGVPLNDPRPLGTTCATGTCDGSGMCVACITEADCTELPPSDECGMRVCSAGVCETDPTAAGTDLSTQSPGDCQVLECDGAGMTQSAADNQDVPDDMNDCSTDGCSGGVPVHMPVMLPHSCGNQGMFQCDVNGNCIGCMMPTDCGTITFCTGWSCTLNVCQVNYTAMGTPLPPANQTPADCQEKQCNGAGDVQDGIDVTDVPPDDGNLCTDETCSGGIPDHPPSVLDTPCNQSGGSWCDGNGACVECNSPPQCPGGMVCESPTCNANTCGLTTTPDDDPAPPSAQMNGDCKIVLCDGMGGTKIQADAADVPVDGNDCTDDVCTGQTPSNPFLPQGTPCGNGQGCDGAGNCTQLPLGATCATSPQCISNHCTDAVCCNTQCNQICRSCLGQDTGGTDGTCSLITAGTDPYNECQGTKTCNAQGMCSN
jgi:hypothetical protein